MEFLGTLATALFNSVLGAIQNWYNAEKSKEYEWAAKSTQAQLESVKDAEKLTLHIATPPLEVVDNVFDWNDGALLGTGVMA